MTTITKDWKGIGGIDGIDGIEEIEEIEEIGIGHQAEQKLQNFKI